MTWSMTGGITQKSTYQSACEDTVDPSFIPRVPAANEERKGPNAKFSTPAFQDAMTWSTTDGRVQKSTYQAACEDTCGPEYIPRDPPNLFAEEGTDGDGGEDDDSTQAPLYYAWGTLPPPAPLAKKSKLKKSKVRVRAKNPHRLLPTSPPCSP